MIFFFLFRVELCWLESNPVDKGEECKTALELEEVKKERKNEEKNKLKKCRKTNNNNKTNFFLSNRTRHQRLKRGEERADKEEGKGRSGRWREELEGAGGHRTGNRGL